MHGNYPSTAMHGEAFTWCISQREVDVLWSTYTRIHVLSRLAARSNFVPLFGATKHFVLPGIKAAKQSSSGHFVRDDADWSRLGLPSADFLCLAAKAIVARQRSSHAGELDGV